MAAAGSGARKAPPAVAIDRVSATYRDGELTVEALRGVSLEVLPGEFVSVIGPSGCGKSTLLSLIAALQRPAAGEIRIHDARAEGRTDLVAFMPQRDLLLPWRTVLDNVILGPEIHGAPRDRARAEALALMPQFGLEGFAHAYPRALSGGMRQRAALLRTVLLHRDILLLDEPFGALDALTRGEMQEWLLTICARLGKTVLFVTHDVEEAVFLSDRVYVMSSRPGTIRRAVAIDLPRPRRRAMTVDPAFVETKHMLLDDLLHQPGGSVRLDADLGGSRQ